MSSASARAAKRLAQPGSAAAPPLCRARGNARGRARRRRAARPGRELPAGPTGRALPPPEPRTGRRTRREPPWAVRVGEREWRRDRGCPAAIVAVALSRAVGGRRASRSRSCPAPARVSTATAGDPREAERAIRAAISDRPAERQPDPDRACSGSPVPATAGGSLSELVSPRSRCVNNATASERTGDGAGLAMPRPAGQRRDRRDRAGPRAAGRGTRRR